MKLILGDCLEKLKDLPSGSLKDGAKDCPRCNSPYWRTERKRVK